MSPSRAACLICRECSLCRVSTRRWCTLEELDLRSSLSGDSPCKVTHTHTHSYTSVVCFPYLILSTPHLLFIRSSLVHGFDTVLLIPLAYPQCIETSGARTLFTTDPRILHSVWVLLFQLRHLGLTSATLFYSDGLGTTNWKHANVKIVTDASLKEIQWNLEN